MALVDALHRSLENHSMWDICTEVLLFLGAVWIAFLVGLVVGWEWKPEWASFSTDKLAYHVMKLLDSSLPSSPRWSRMPSFKSPAGASLVDPLVDKNPPSTTPSEFGDCSTSELNEEQQSNVAGLLTVEDLEHLYKLVEVKDGGPAWIHMMDRSTPGMSYQAWRRDPKNGPPQYRSRTVFEDASPEIVRDLFWDDEFRKHWDDMLASFNILDECHTTGTMLVQWIRKFPFFCSDREYIIGRRIWDSGRSYYCVTKGASGSSSLPRRDKPRRVDLYYSSWFIRAVESRRGDGQLTACEVLLYHHEDMGIPWEIAKLGVRQGMWGTVKKIEPGLRAYQKARASGAPLSRSAIMAQINTKVNLELLRSLGSLVDGSSESESVDPSENPPGPNIAKLLIIGGAVVLACSIDRGLLTKTFIFGVGRRFANIGKRVRVQ